MTLRMPPQDRPSGRICDHVTVPGSMGRGIDFENHGRAGADGNPCSVERREYSQPIQRRQPNGQASPLRVALPGGEASDPPRAIVK